MAKRMVPIRLLKRLLIVLALATKPLLAQATPQPTRATTHMAPATPGSFAVATIRLSKPGSSGGGFDAEGTRFRIWNETIARMISFAYSVHERQIMGATDSLSRDRYDIVGIADGDGEPNLRQQQEMIQKLLAERFKLRFHHERREMPVYAIQIAKGGPKLKVTVDPEARPDWAIDNHGGARTYAYTSASIAVFMLGEQTVLDRPLVDQTGLTGRYDFYLRYSPEETDSADPNPPPGLFTAVQEQLGLKLQPMRAFAEALVIDHVEKPTEN